MGELPTIIETISALGPASVGTVFAVLWWLERKERVECHKTLQETTKDLHTQTLNAIHEASNSIAAVTVAVAELRGVISQSTTSMTSLLKSRRS